MTTKVTYVKTTSLNQKFSQIVAALVLLIITVNIWLNVFSQGKDMIDENTQVLADNILLQTSHSAKYYIQTDDLTSLAHLTESALKSSYIHEMVIYDARGVILSQSDNALTTKERFLDGGAKEIKQQTPVAFASDIRAENNDLLGFVRITVLKQQLQQGGVDFVKSINKQVLLLLLIAGVIGYLLTIGLKPFSKNAYYVKE